MRDVMLQKTPAVFGGNTLYATSAILASGVMVALKPLGIEPFATLAAIGVGMALTLVARKRQWKLPDSYSWSPKRTLDLVLPRPRWTKRRAAASAQTPPDAPR